MRVLGVDGGERAAYRGPMMTNRSMPVDVLVPVLGYPDVSEAVRRLGETFGFTLRWQVEEHRAQLAVGESAGIAVVEGGVASGADHVMVRVDDVDALVERARSAGAEIVADPVDFPYGERQATVRDFSGRAWVFTQSVADVDPADWGAGPR